MADYNAIRKEYEEDEVLNESLSKKLQTNNTLYDSKKTAITDTYNKQIEASKADYEDAYRENAVQKKINEFYIKEDMANMGLTNSGLSRSQITANQLSYANQKAAIDRQRQSMVDSLTAEMTSLISSAEDERLSNEQSIRDSDMEYRDSLAATRYNTEVEAETEQKKAQAEAEAEKAKAYYDYLTESAKTAADQQAKISDKQSSEYQSLYSHLNDIADDKDYDYAAQAIYSYLEKYDIDFDEGAGRSELEALLRAAGLSYEQFVYYAKNKTVYTTLDNYKVNEGTGESKGIIKYDYKTDGKANYQIVVKKNTYNGGWVFNKGVDRNDVVDIYYPDGTPVATNVKLGELNKVGLALTKITDKATKDDVANGTIFDVELDLSKEDFKRVKK